MSHASLPPVIGVPLAVLVTDLVFTGRVVHKQEHVVGRGREALATDFGIGEHAGREPKYGYDSDSGD